MSDRLSREAVRERDERDARFFAWDVPGDAHIVALVHEADDAERSATVADAIATSVARRREHTLLLCVAPGPSPLDELLGGAGSPGLPAALEGRARLTDVAVQRVDRPFVYLPAGRDPVAMRALLGDDLLTSFIERVRERGGTLFIVLSEETLLADGFVSLLDGYVALGDVRLPAELEHLAQFGRVRFEDPEPGRRPSGERVSPATPIALPELAGEVEAGVDAGGGTPRSGDDSTPPTGDGARSPGAENAPGDAAPVGAPSTGGGSAGDGRDATSAEATGSGDPEAGAIVADADDPVDRPSPTPRVHPEDAISTVGEPPVEPGGIVEGAPERPSAPLWSRHRKPPAFPVARIAFGAAVIAAVAVVWWMIARAADPTERAGPTQAEAAQTPGDDAAAETPPVFDAAAATRAFESAPALGYSVLIASYADRTDADERLAKLRSRSEGFYFLSPTPVRGVVYHRVFAGALAGRDEGQALMGQLVEARLKDASSEWDVRPSGLTFDLGLFAGRAQADARVRTLAGRSIPAYALAATGAADAPWRVYGGAFESERASGPMAEMLTGAGEPATLVERRGAIPSPSSNE